MSFLKDKLIEMVFGIVLSELTEEKIEAVKAKLNSLLEYGADEGLDYLEEYIKESESKLDDKLLPIFELFRKVFNIPDGDD